MQNPCVTAQVHYIECFLPLSTKHRCDFQSCFPEMIPDVFHGIQFRTIRRKKKQGHICRNTEFVRGMPSCGIKKHEAMVMETFLGCCRKKYGHYFRIHPRHHKRNKLSICWTHGSHNIHELAHNLMSDNRALPTRRPTPTQIIDPSKTAFVLKEYLDSHAWRYRLDGFPQNLREFFLKTS